jgi:hypothetical protein
MIGMMNFMSFLVNVMATSDSDSFAQTPTTCD